MAEGATVQTTITSGQPQGIIGAGSAHVEHLTINNPAAQDPAVLRMLVTTFTQELSSTQAQRAAAEAKVAEIATELKFTTAAVIGFFQTLREQSVAPEQLPQKLAQIANHFEATRQRLAALDMDDPATKALADQARVELEKGHPDAASALLQRSEEAELAAAAQARALAQQASAAADARQLNAARAREGRGDVALTQLRYEEAAGHFVAAASLLPASWFGDRGRLLWRQAEALHRQGDEYGDNAALIKSIAIWKDILNQEYPRERVPLQWATTQNNLGLALGTLGKRESGTARLEEAVAAYRLALEEQPRDRVPLDWARTQDALGSTLRVLGERETGTARLEEAVAAFRVALEERTRERVPLDWAATQGSLGEALRALGWREAGTARLEEAVAAFPRRPGGAHPRARPARMGLDPGRPRQHAPGARGAGGGHGAAGGGGGGFPRRPRGTHP